MNKSTIPLAFGLRQLRRMAWLLFVLWTLAVAASAVWSAHLLHDAMFEAATQDARSIVGGPRCMAASMCPSPLSLRRIRI
jgi:predicted lysophospholipase L1 biosynthesis ABC-type transport system permease subunit